MSERILAFDTSGASLSVALWQDGRAVWLSTREFAPGRPEHASALVPTVQRGLAECGWTVASLDGLGVTVGPGSYTGLRIGIATAKGLALARDLPVAGVGTLEALAWPWLGPERVVLAWLDARRGQVFAAVYATEPGGAPEEAPLEMEAPARLPAADAVQRAAEAARRAGRPVLYAAGDGHLAAGAGAALEAAGRLERVWRPPAPARVSAEAVAALAVPRLRSGGEDPLALAPLYVAAPHVGPVPGPALAAEDPADGSPAGPVTSGTDARA